MKSAHLRSYAWLVSTVLVSSLVASCGRPEHPRASAQQVNVVPQGDASDIALACGRASVLMYIMTLDDWPPDYRYLNPQGIPGYDASQRERDALAAAYLGEAIARTGVWNAKVENDPRVLTQALRENGWTIIEAGKRIAANERSWRNLEERVGWCIDHYQVELPDETKNIRTHRQS